MSSFSGRVSLKVGLLVSLATLLLTSCGGGGSGGGSAAITAPIATASPLSVVATLQPTVVTPTSAEAAKIVESTEVAVEFPSGSKAQTGDVMVVNGNAFKLGPSDSPQFASANLRFTKVKPALHELFSALVFDGQFDTTSAPTTAINKSIKAQAGSGVLSCFATTDLPSNSNGTKCTFDIKDINYKATLSGEFGMGVKGVFKSWDAIANTGSGELTFAMNGKLALGFSDSAGWGTLDSANSDETCNSGLGLVDIKSGVKTGRVRLFTLPVPVSLGGLAGLQFPVCVSAGVSAKLVGEMFSLGGNGTWVVAVGNSKAPTLSKGPPPPAINNPLDSALWSLSPTTSGLERVAFETKGEVALETSLEIWAMNLAYVGLQGRLTGESKGSTEASLVRFGKVAAKGDLKASPDYCHKFQLSSRFTVTAFGEVKGLISWLTAGNPKSTVKIYDALLWEGTQEKIGLCTRVKSNVAITQSASETNIGEAFSISANVTLDGSTTGFATDQMATGSVLVKDQESGQTICNITLDSKTGRGACNASYSLSGQRNLVSSYSGDSNFLSSSASAVAHLVLGNFSFEVAEIDPSRTTATRLKCSQISNFPFDGGLASFDNCTSDISIVVRCIGLGCAPGRFFLGIRSASNVMTAYCAWGASCATRTSTQFNLGSSADFSQTGAVYSPGSWWTPLGTGWVRPFNNDITPLQNGFGVWKGFTWLTQPTNPLNDLWGNTARSLTIDFNIFDSAKNKYYPLSFQSNVP